MNKFERTVLKRDGHGDKGIAIWQHRAEVAERMLKTATKKKEKKK